MIPVFLFAVLLLLMPTYFIFKWLYRWRQEHPFLPNLFYTPSTDLVHPSLESDFNTVESTSVFSRQAPLRSVIVVGMSRSQYPSSPPPPYSSDVIEVIHSNESQFDVGNPNVSRTNSSDSNPSSQLSVHGEDGYLSDTSSLSKSVVLDKGSQQLDADYDQQLDEFAYHADHSTVSQQLNSLFSSRLSVADGTAEIYGKHGAIATGSKLNISRRSFHTASNNDRSSYHLDDVDLNSKNASRIAVLA